MRMKHVFHSRPSGLVCMALAAAALTACGGGGDDDGAGPVGLAFSVGGKVEGLSSGKQMQLQNSGRDTLDISANGAFTFNTRVAKGGQYDVTVLKQPDGQTCVVTQGKGAVEGQVDNVLVSCSATAGGGGGGTGSGSAPQWIEGAVGSCVTYPAGTVTDHASTNVGARIEDLGNTVTLTRGALKFAGPNCTGAYTFTTGAVHTYSVRARYTYSGVPVLRLTGTIVSAEGVTSGPVDETWWFPTADKFCQMADSPITQTNDEVGALLPFTNTDTCMVPFNR